jgi:mannose-6-phosphate isomerase-like protein (cupin superfamily)
MTATVARAAEIDAFETDSGALITTVLDTRGVGGRLVRSLVEVPAGAAHAGVAGPGGELWFVTAGDGELTCGVPASAPAAAAAPPPAAAPARRRLGPDHGSWLPAGTSYELRAPESEPVHLDVVALPGPAPEPGPAPPGGLAAPLISELSTCDVERTGDRTFRVVFGPGRGCAAATQFVGEIPPGRAPVHSHTYDEVVLVLAGTGIAHVNGAEHEIGPGTCVYLPPGQQHCLQNPGPGLLRVLGVFQPGGSPAAKKEATGSEAAGPRAAP